MATVLVVDDDPAIRDYVGDMLELDGHTVRFALDGPGALAEIAQARPDCVILDVMMPGMNGHEVLATLRQTDGGPELPVIMLTAFSDDEQLWRAWNGGVDYFIAKPFDPEQLLGILRYLSEGADGSGEPAGHGRQERAS
ncbi:MAG TPA: response regulator [Kineosporiaceae bacterium]|nr:response regulator [Kineosporiaceae bacterium]